MQRLLPQVNGVALAWSMAGFLIISITVLACAAPDYATGKYVFATFINETGWPDGIAWLLGMWLAILQYVSVANDVTIIVRSLNIPISTEIVPQY
jgi:cobalamin synthase